MSTLQDLQQEIINFCAARDWNQFHNPKDLAVSLTLEASEVLECFQWKNEEEMRSYIAQKPEELSEELADVFYWLLIMSEKFNIDLEDAFAKKMAKNAKKYPIEHAKGNHKKYTELQK